VGREIVRDEIARDGRGPVGRLVARETRERKRRGETRRRETRTREKETRPDSLVKVGGAWHAWRRKHKAWFERVSTLSPVCAGPDISGCHMYAPCAGAWLPTRVTSCEHNAHRAAPRRAAPPKARRKEKMEDEEVRGQGRPGW